MEAILIPFLLHITFFVGPADPNTLILPPPTHKRVQELKKKITRLEKPVIIRSADLNGDGIVNLFDYALFAQKWLENI